MRNRAMTLICSCLLLLSTAVPAVENFLKSNPFERPPVKDAGEASRNAAAQASLPAMKLRSTMAAGPASLANIGGEIVGLGEEVNGYRLLAVHPRHVVLEKNDIQKTLSIDNETEKNQ